METSGPHEQISEDLRTSGRFRDELGLTDARGIRHTVDVTAESLFEAAGLGLAALKKDGWTDLIGPATTLEVEVRHPAVRHAVSVIQIQRWLQGASTSPNERVKKDRLNRLLSSR